MTRSPTIGASPSKPDSSDLSIGELSKALGVPVDTLRTWERRHGVPQAIRLPSGHRRYPYSSLAELRLVAEAVQRGHRASSVLRMSSGELASLLAEPNRTQLLASSFEEPQWAPLIEATLSLNSSQLDQHLNESWERLGSASFLDTVLGPFLSRVGEMWINGQLGVSHEHFMSERVRIFLAGRWREASERARGPKVVCASLPGEHHVLGLHMAALAVSLAGMQVTFLGQDMPIGSTRDAVLSLGASTVIVSVSIASDRSVAHALLSRLRAELPAEVEVLAGGAGAPPVVEGVRVFNRISALQDWAVSRA